MADLAARAEVGHLSRELHLDDGRLDFLAAFDADDLRRLRRSTVESLASRHRSTFAGMARAAKLLPAKLLPPIAEKAIGPLVCSKIAAELEPGHARKIVGSFSVPFLADLCRTIDTASAADVLAAIRPEQAVRVGEELHRRGDVDPLGRFIDVVDPRSFPPMLEILDDDALLRVAVVAESRERLSLIFAELTDHRILELVECAVRSDLLDEALVVVAELDAEQLVRTVGIIVDAGDTLLTDIVAAIAGLGAWDQLLPVIADLDPEHVARVASAPVLRRPDVFESIVVHVETADAVDDFVAVIGSLPPDKQHELASAVADSAPDVASRLVAVADRHGVDGLPALDVLRSRG